MKHKKITTGNYNCNRSLVNESFFKALDAFIPNDIKGKISRRSIRKTGITRSIYIS